MKYSVTLVKKEVFDVEAANEEEAIEKACEMCDNDQWAFFEPVDEFLVEPLEEN